MIPTRAVRRSVLIVDDEPLARRGLRRVVEGRDDLYVIGECDNGLAALEFITRQPPALVLLDVQMPGLDGLEVVRRLPAKAAPLVVFVTAFDTFAIAAFELAAVDYVVKPFTNERVLGAIDRALARYDEHAAASTLVRLAETLDDAALPHAPEPGRGRTEPSAPGERRFRERFLVNVGAKVSVVHANHIAWIRANGYYARLITHDREEHVVRLALDLLERELDPSAFIRVHRSAIVSLAEVRGVERTEGTGAVVVLRSGARVPVSRSRREALFRALGGVPH